MNNKSRKTLILAVRYIVIIFWCVFTLIPIYTALVAALTKAENLGNNFLYPVD